MSRLRSRALLALGTLVVTACAGQEPGSVSLTFSWEQRPDTAVWVWIRVEERPGDPTVPGTILESAGPAPWLPDGTGVTLQLARVSNGTDRVAVVEVREGESPALPVLFYGVSDPFAVEPGRRVVVEVPLALRTPEPYRSDVPVELLFGDELEAGRTSVSEAEARRAVVRTRSSGALALVLANDSSFSANRTEVSLAGAAGDPRCVREAGPAVEGDTWVTWDVCTIEGWDLLAGLPALGDGPYSVFVRFVDRFGYESTPKTAVVRLDTQGPTVVSASLSPEVAGADQTVRLVVSLDEPLLEREPGGAVLEVTPPALELSGPQQVGQSNTYLWTTETGSGEGDGAEEEAVFTFAVRLTDPHGNSSDREVLLDDRQQPLRLTLDLVAPTVVAGSVSLNDAKPFRHGDVVVVGLTVSEDLPAPPVLRVAGSEAGVAGEDGRRYTYTYDVSEDRDRQGIELVEVVLTDRAGNVTLDVDSVPALVFDFAPPALARASIDPPYANEASEIRIQAVFDEELAAGTAPSLLVRRPAPEADEDPLAPKLFGEGQVDGASVVWSRPVSGGPLPPLPEGTLLLRVPVSDPAGNRSAELELGELTIDTVPPALAEGSEASLSHEYAGDGSEVCLTFRLPAEEELAGDPVVHIGGAPMVRDAGRAPGGSHRFTHVVDSGRRGGEEPAWGWDREGVAPVSVSLRDLAGNQTDLSAGGVVYDFTPPELVGTPQLSRCDGRWEAREGQNDLWVGLAQVEEACSEPGRWPVEVAFVLSEPTAAAPTLEVAGRPWELLGGEGGDSHFRYGYVPSGEEPETDSARVPAAGQAVMASVTDRAGNRADLELGTVRFDFWAPAGMAEEAQPLVELYRAPWGAEETEGNTLAELRACRGPGEAPAEPGWDWCPEDAAAGAFEPRSTVSVHAARQEAGAWRCTDEVLATGEPQSGGIALPIPGDRPAVCLVETDPAGNRSQAALVASVEWVATMGGKVVGSLLENPHRYETRRWFAGTLFQPGARERGGGELAGGGRLVTAGGGTWRRMGPHDGPEGRERHALAYDSARGRIVLYGGRVRLDDRQHEEGETWEWDGLRWSLRVPADPEEDGNPPPLLLPALAYDSRRGRVVLFGGSTRGFAGAETWEWDGESWVLGMPADPEGDGDPVPRATHGLAYDDARGVVVLFGGRVGWDERFDDTWEWDGESWHLRCDGLPAGDVCLGRPPRRSTRGLAYDRERERMVLFGGEAWVDDEAARRDDTWEWDGHDWVLVERADPERDGNPEPRRWHALARHDASGRVVLFGGGGWVVDDFGIGRKTLLDDTWEWDGSSWTRRGPSDPEGDGDPPWDHSSSGLAYDAARERTILLRNDRIHRLTKVWKWDGVSWERGLPLDPEGDGDPIHRGYFGVTYDSRRERVVLFGGHGWPGSDDAGPRDAVWEWDGESWTWRLPTDPEEDGNPAARYEHAMAFDSQRGMTVLFGGVQDVRLHLNDTWEWDGESWAHMASDGPVGGSEYALAFDSRRGRTVLFGGGAGRPGAETWEWDGELWLRSASSDPGGDGDPSERIHHALAFDELRGRTVLFGGGGQGAHLEDLWEWDGESWTLRLATDPDGDGNPPRVSGPLLAYDSRRHRIVLRRAVSSTGTPETWEWDGGAEARPAHTLHVAFSSAGAAVSPGWHSVGAFLRAGGDRQQEGGEPGAELMVWDEGRWRSVATNQLVPDAPGPLSWSTADPNAASRLFFGPQQTVSFAVAPVARNGTGTAAVAVDYAEVRVRYRLP